MEHEARRASSPDIELVVARLDLARFESKEGGADFSPVSFSFTDFLGSLDALEVLRLKTGPLAASPDFFYLYGPAGDGGKRQRCPENLAAAFTE